ncbi:helix-turn-helix domain-containing protein [Pediococcus acidilactici]|nr:helix-turn-helix domain-containing protein [Pediococcus acidilactici]
MDFIALDKKIRDLNYVEETQRKNHANYNYMRLNFKESPIPKMPKYNFFKHGDLTIVKGNRFSYVPAHTHDFIELNYMYSGNCIQSLNNEQFEFKQGQLLLMDKNTVQKIGYTGENDTIINILLKNSLTVTHLLELLAGQTNPVTDFLQNCNLKTTNHNFMIFDLPAESLSRSLIMDLFYAVFVSAHTINNHVLELLFSTLITQLPPLVSHHHLNFTADSNVELLAILKYIEQHYSTTNLQYTSKHFGYNMNYLSNKIKAATGQTFKELIEQRRLYAAQELLFQTNLSLDQISQRIGYKNPSSLNRLFKKYVNTTPISYKTELIKNRDDLY